MANKSKKFHGYVSYLSEVLRILLTYQEKRITALINGTGINQEVLLMTVTKGTTFGGGFMINPYAKNNDGLLDVCVVGKIPNLIRLNYVLKMKKGGHRNLKNISFYKSEEVRIEENPLLIAHMDGEVIGEPPFFIKILPRKIQFRI
jgi:diacylglycerol kinase family enzyme